MSRLTQAAATIAGTCLIVLGGVGTAAADPNPPVIGATGDSPGVLSGDVIQIPIGIPVNVCGDSIDLIGLLNPAAGNTCVNR